MYENKKPWLDDNFIQTPVSDDNEGEFVWKVVQHSERMPNGPLRDPSLKSIVIGEYQFFF